MQERGLTALHDPGVAAVFWGLAEMGIRSVGIRQRTLLCGAIAWRLDEGRTPEDLVRQVDLQLDRAHAAGIRSPWSFFLSRTAYAGPSSGAEQRPERPVGRCPEHMQDLPCTGCVIDARLAAAAGGAS